MLQKENDNMWNALQKIGFFLVVLILTAAIFWLFFLDKQSKQNVLEYSLSLLGDDLMAMVPEGADKKPVQELYDSFLQKTKQGKVEPKQVEYVAANIMNLSNAETEITPEQAEAILQLSLSSPERIERIGEETHEPLTEEPHFSSEERKSLGERLKTLHEFNSEMKEAMRDYAPKQEKRQRQIHYRIEGDLKIAMDKNLKAEFDRDEFKQMAKELKQLEKERIFEWKENFTEELEQEMESLRLELESLKELTELSQLEALKDLESLESLKSLEKLESLEFMPVIDADSIRAIVEQSLKAAGLDPHNKEGMRNRIDSIKKSIKIEKLEALEELESLKSLESLHESLKSLESLKYMPIIDGDSIRAIVEKSLEEAGINRRKK